MPDVPTRFLSVVLLVCLLLLWEPEEASQMTREEFEGLESLLVCEHGEWLLECRLETIEEFCEGKEEGA